jgi:hypothetical protein
VQKRCFSQTHEVGAGWRGEWEAEAEVETFDVVGVVIGRFRRLPPRPLIPMLLLLLFCPQLLMPTVARIAE